MFDEPFLFFLTLLAVYIVVQLRKIRKALRDVTRLEERLIDLQRDLRLLAKPREKPATTPEPSVSHPPPIPAMPATPSTPVRAPLPVQPVSLTPSAPPLPVEPPPPPEPPPAWLVSAKDILSRIWQWILVGEEYRPKGVTMEYAVATTWLMRVGIVLLVACVGYFLKWSLDNNLMGPTTRVAMSILFGMGMLGGGMRLFGGRWNILGQGFVGGGLATLYFSMYALGPLYHLLDSTALVFALMILVTLAAGILALYANSMLIAIFGIIGGFITPVLLSTGVPNFIGLFSYLLLLNLGILGIAAARQWRLLNYLGFVLTYALYIGSLSLYKTTDFPVALTFLSLFFIAQSTLVFQYNLRRALPASLLEIIHLVLNASLFSWFAYALIIEAAGRPYPALMTVAIALYYILHVVAFITLKSRDRRLLIALIALAGFYTTLTMPLALEQESLTLAWALQAFMFLWLGRRLDSAFLRQTAYAVYAITFIRLTLFEFPRFDFAAAPADMTAYWKILIPRLWTFGGAIASVVAAFFLELRQSVRPATPTAEALPDTPDITPASLTHRIFFWGGIATVFLYLHSELHLLFGFFTPWRPAALTLLWCLMAAGFLLLYRATRSKPLFAGLIFFAAGAVAKTLFVDMPGWHLCERGYFNMAYTPFYALMRWLDFTAVLALLGVGAVWFHRPGGPKTAVPALFGYTAIALLWLYLTTELYSLLHWKLREFEAGGISILWTLFAFSFITGGIWKRLRAIRIAGLALFTLVAFKVFMIDLAHMPPLYRVVALMVIGVLLLLGSFAYLRASKKFIQE